MITSDAHPLTAQVFCPSCTYELEPWEVHLLKTLDCPCCGCSLELEATSVDLVAP